MSESEMSPAQMVNRIRELEDNQKKAWQIIQEYKKVLKFIAEDDNLHAKSVAREVMRIWP